jgi:tetratricopeptide (TPR) repeat protein
MRRGAELLRDRNVLIFDGLIKIALAEAEARAGDVDRALAILDEALATCERTGHRSFAAELHRVRGGMLLRRANLAPAEEAFHTAIAVAKPQGTRSFELRAALSLAKLYQSTARPPEAHAILAPALEGFSPTAEMPEIAEAQALLAALADTARTLVLHIDFLTKKSETRVPGSPLHPGRSHWHGASGARIARPARRRANSTSYMRREGGARSEPSVITALEAGEPQSFASSTKGS